MRRRRMRKFLTFIADVVTAVPIGAAGENFLEISYFCEIFNEILKNLKSNNKLNHLYGKPVF